MRAFVGISLPGHVRDALEQLQQALQAAQADVKWVEPSNLHVTLKFLDEITEEQRQAVEAMLARVAAYEPAFQLGIEGVGAFPSPTAPRVIWVGLVTGKEVVARIVEAIEREGANIPLRKEERSFSPHLTLGRVRSSRHQQRLVQQLREVTWQAPSAWQVSSLTLYQSELSSAGPRYTVLADLPFGKPTSSESAGTGEASPAPSGPLAL